MATRFVDESAEPVIQGFLEEPEQATGDGIVLTHGAGSNCQAKLLVGMSEALAAVGFVVLRFDLPFRAERPTGPPRPGSAEKDREGIRRAACVMRTRIRGRLFLAGHSYGGRQASMLATEEPGMTDGLLLLSYPLHPPKKPLELRTKHFRESSVPAFFAHGTRDPFGSIAEMTAALKLLHARHELLAIEGAGHDLTPRKTSADVAAQIANSFLRFTRIS